MLETGRKNPSIALSLAFTTIVFGGAAIPAASAKDTILRVGIVQRFGDAPEERLTLTGTRDDKLTLRVVEQNGQVSDLQTERLKLEVSPLPLTEPAREERVILSDHATFETAEDSAGRWRQMGIRVEITQPERWQVWAERDVYKTPLLRRWLLESLKKNGHTTPYLDTTLRKERLQVSFVVNGTRYFPKEMTVATKKESIRVTGNGARVRVYGGSLRLQPNAYGTFTLVNLVPLETYLRGVVPHEIGPDAPESAAKAQAIIARTYALRNLRRFRSDDYELCADTHCQVYYGLTGTNPRADRAVRETRGLVLTYGNELVDALYSSTTGGVTAPFSDVWDGSERPYLKAVIDSPDRVWDLSRQSLADENAFRQFINLKDGFNETGRKVFRWQRQASIAALNKDLEKYLERQKHPLSHFTTIQWMEVTKRSPSGRILTLTIQTDKGILELYKNEVRSAFAPPRSTLFYLDPVYDQNRRVQGYNFVGGGFGHGVGLSQFGSYNLARLGWSAEQILSFYYPSTRIQPLNDSIVLWRAGE